MRDVAVAQHDAFDGALIKGSALDLLWAIQRQVHVHSFSEWEQPFVKRSPADSFERHGAIRANCADVDDPCGIFDEPRRGKMFQGDPALDPQLKVQFVRAEDARDLLDSGLDLSVGRPVPAAQSGSALLSRRA